LPISPFIRCLLGHPCRDCRLGQAHHPRTQGSPPGRRRPAVRGADPDTRACAASLRDQLL